ncbi:MAG: hypothetical protein A3K19_27960 [Lentisphaerae bacterium RIFOXYB12_FULL_65_16]|nr:MAG: hypothetical protein A3K18_12015 [Lentisphaerae bacterium RIFOXYA12_64_32]OGV88174.1 MAG: hypothetical protein A3K19_27960 [Lentisphaerae bacterium RIFOXYB12_FULL_65_16]
MQQTNYRIIDCHIHPRVDMETETNGLIGTGSLREQVDALQRTGISQACGSVIKLGTATSFDDIRRLNDKALFFRDLFPDFYIPGIVTHPHFPEESCREVERCCGGEGARWIGELVGYVHGYGVEYATPNALAIMRAAVKYRPAVNIHCHDLQVVEALCIAVPELNFVLAHPGAGKDEILPRVALVARLPNLHLDISGSGIDRLGMLRRSVDLAGKEKILFGSDYPINNPAVYVHGLLFESLSEDERTAIFAGNFLRLTGIA